MNTCILRHINRKITALFYLHEALVHLWQCHLYSYRFSYINQILSLYFKANLYLKCHKRLNQRIPGRILHVRINPKQRPLTEREMTSNRKSRIKKNSSKTQLLISYFWIKNGSAMRQGKNKIGHAHVIALPLCDKISVRATITNVNRF